MTDKHPITPPPKLVREWLGTYFGTTIAGEVSEVELALATQAAQWGADQELEACCEWLKQEREEPGWANRINLHFLRAARRPKPPSLKEQALRELKNWTDEKHGPGGEVFLCEGLSVAIIRRALEALP
jgi:hypothetical protein